MTYGFRTKVKKALHIYDSFIGKLMSAIVTFGLVCIGWVLFRANTISDAFYILEHLGTAFTGWWNMQYIYEVITGLGLNIFELIVTATAIIFLMATEMLCGSKPVYDVIEKKNAVVRIIFYLITAAFILSAGVFYEAGAFIYFQF